MKHTRTQTYPCMVHNAPLVNANTNSVEKLGKRVGTYFRFAVVGFLIGTGVFVIGFAALAILVSVI